jgi:hypothetical protein
VKVVVDTSQELVNPMAILLLSHSLSLTVVSLPNVALNTSWSSLIDSLSKQISPSNLEKSGFELEPVQRAEADDPLSAILSGGLEHSPVLPD